MNTRSLLVLISIFILPACSAHRVPTTETQILPVRGLESIQVDRWTTGLLQESKTTAENAKLNFEGAIRICNDCTAIDQATARINRNVRKRPVGRTYAIEEVFESFSEYQHHLTKALSLFQDQQKMRNPTLKRYVPEYLEIEFDASIKAPRIYFPRYRGVVVVQLPSNKLPARKRSVIRERNLMRYAGIVKMNEIAVGDELAVRMKLIERSKQSRPRSR